MSAHRSLINKLLLACVAMFAFGFALAPLYDVFCDITGINGKTDKVAAAAPDRIDRAREISVEFLATHDPAVAVDFAPRPRASSSTRATFRWCPSWSRTARASRS